MYINTSTPALSSFLVTQTGPVRYVDVRFPTPVRTGVVSHQTAGLNPTAVITSLIKTAKVFALEDEPPGRKKYFAKWIQFGLLGFTFPLGPAHRRFLCHLPAPGNG